MRAIRFHRIGGPEVLTLEEVPEPTPGPDDVLIDIKAIGVNYADTHFRKGEYFIRPVFPQIPGMEAAGEIVGTGERVMVFGANSYAERMIARRSHVYPIPEGLDFVRAAALPVQGLTAHHVLSLFGRLAKGETVLVQAAGGGVGTLAIQIARSMGAQVIGLASPSKLELVKKLGAEAIDATSNDWVQQVKQLTNNRGVDVLLEMTGGTEQYKRNLAVLAPLGRMVVYGGASGDMRGTIEPVGLLNKNNTVSGYYMPGLLKNRELCAPALDDLAHRVISADVQIVIGGTLPLTDAAQVHRDMEARKTQGKMILVP
ncbi:MAG: quinone oxidoreductase family protein [Polyangiales bacterium]